MAINGTVTRVLVDSGAQSTVLRERQFHNLVRSGLRAMLQPEERNLRVYGNGPLADVGKFEATNESLGQKVVGTILVTERERGYLLGTCAKAAGSEDSGRICKS